MSRLLDFLVEKARVFSRNGSAETPEDIAELLERAEWLAIENKALKELEMEKKLLLAADPQSVADIALSQGRASVWEIFASMRAKYEKEKQNRSAKHAQ